MAKAGLLFSLKVLMILLFSGWIAVWILKPTRIWTNKWKAAEDCARPTIFGYYGLNFAVYTFPIIALAIIGFIYLSLKPPWPKSRLAASWTAHLSNPFIIKSPLGILSSVEILAIFLFTVFLVWTFYIRISNDFKTMKLDKTLKLSIWQYKFFRVATRFGLLAEACLALLLFPVLRGMSLFKLVGIQFEASVRYHVWLGTAMIFFATFHGVGTLFVWGIKHQLQDQMWKWQKTGRIYLAGEITLVTGLVIWITSLPIVRRKRFEIFYYTHHLYVVFLVCFLFHTGDRHFYMVFPGVFLFGIDKLLRILQSRPATCLVSARTYQCKAVELNLPKDPTLKYTPTSVVFIKIPSISKFQWHSFSVTSCSDDETISVIIKCEGWWTNFLYNMINAELDSYLNSKKCIPVAVEGPYGPASMDFLRYDSLLLVAGGIGVAPFLSILRELASAQGIDRSRLPTKVQLVYVVKKFQDISLLNSISHLLINHPSPKWDLKLKLYVTREEQTNTTIRGLLNEFCEVEMINFDRKCSSYAVHGLQTFPWMAAMAGFSAFLFIVFLSCFNHAFLPVTKKALKMKNPSSVSDLFLITSFIIAIVCSIFVAIVLRWRRTRDDISPVSKKQRNLTNINFVDTRGAGALEEHEVHFGVRPNFEDILCDFTNETGGRDIGLLVCGPESMNESVASSCRRYHQGFSVIDVDNKEKKKSCFNFHSLNFTL